MNSTLPGVQQVGFDGTEDLYGVGIRIGYYTASLSLWISNLWAPAESYFLRPITLIFLTAVFIGVSVLSSNAQDVYAIEPMMMMQIAYYTYGMSLGGPKPYDLMVWEQDYFHYFMMKFIGLCLHAFDTWFWFYGLFTMLPTPGVKTNAIIIYFGQVDIFAWIRYPMRVYVVAMLIVHLYLLSTTLFQRQFEKYLDREISPARLKQLSQKWLEELHPGAQPLPDGKDLRKSGFLLPPGVTRQASMSSVKSAPVRTHSLSQDFNKEASVISRASARYSRPDTELTLTDNLDKKASLSRPFSPSIVIPTQEQDLEPQLERTTTNRLKSVFLGWQSQTHYTAEYTPHYTPTLQSISEATQFLNDLNKPGRSLRKWSAFGAFWYEIPIKFCRLVPTILTHRLRPRVLLAVLIHLRALLYTQEQYTMTVWRWTLIHPLYRKIRPEDLGLASRIMFSTNPRRPPHRSEIFSWAFATFTTCALLMIGTELAIQWNEIRGVQNLSTVGQLIPAAIGMGGLIKVLWSAMFEKTELVRLCFGRCRGDKERAVWSDACEVYHMANSAWERRNIANEDVGDEKKDKEKEVDV